ncbi:hypothetical protein OH77DRAFT_813944 [Trametes cingulata]|nr:hypothetical protein OH77DRAFT_813944 [Trametes cingulata]
MSSGVINTRSEVTEPTSRGGWYTFNASPGPRSTATAKALSMHDIVREIVAVFPQPPGPLAEQVPETMESKAAKKGLVTLALVNQVFFYSAMEVLWKGPIDGEILLKVLCMDSPPSPPRSSQITQEATQLDYATRVFQGNGYLSQPSYQRFRFYSACVRELRVCTANCPTSVFSHIHTLTSQLRSGDHIFPALERLVWIEPRPWVPWSDIVPFLAESPLLTSLALSVQMHSNEYWNAAATTLSGRTDCAAAIVRLCSAVSQSLSATPSFSNLVIEIPTFIPVPSAILRLFDGLESVELQMSIAATSAESIELPAPLRVHGRLVLRELDLFWNMDSHVQSIVQDVSFPHLQELSITSTHPSHTFLADVRFLSLQTSSSLTTISVCSMLRLWPPLNGQDFSAIVSPLLARRNLRQVSFALPGYSFLLCPSDLEDMAASWPHLEALHLSFRLSSCNTLPNIQYILPSLTLKCPQLRFLHLPGLATYPSSSRTTYIIPARPDSSLAHLSSDTFVLQNDALDVAAALAVAFPSLRQLGPPGVPSPWAVLHNLINAIRNDNQLAILQHVVMSMQEGIYQKSPLSLGAILLSSEAWCGGRSG